jgi:O-antigen/teichoic acid export membrane protein
VSVLKRNIVANFSGNVWTGIMSLIFVPLYIHFMGIEAYGLVGIFVTLSAIFGLLDMGLSNTLNREMARLAVQEGKAQEMRDLVRTLEIPYWVVGLLIGLIVIVLSPLIAYRWVNAESLLPKTVQTAIMIIGLVVTFQWPLSFYSGGLMGLERQVLLNCINVVIATFRGLGAVVILWLVSPTVVAFFSWQLIVSIIHTGLIVFFLWKSLPEAAETPRFHSELLSNIWRFAAGITGITLMSTILMQLDKVILSRMLNLKMFGYYALASAVAMTLYRFIAPIYSATYPRFTNLVALGATEEITRLYHRSTQLVSVLVVPAAVVVALFSKEILLLWTKSPLTVEHTHLLVSILVIGTAINGPLNIPYALQLATGWTRLAFIVSLVSVIGAVPLMISLTKWYGAVGAASVWVILNVSELVFLVSIMHRRLLPHEKWRWYFQDVGLPFGVALLFAGVFRLTISIPVENLALFACIIIISAVTLVATALATPVTRDWIQGQASRWRAFYAARS